MTKGFSGWKRMRCHHRHLNAAIEHAPDAKQDDGITDDEDDFFGVSGSF